MPNIAEVVPEPSAPGTAKRSRTAQAGTSRSHYGRTACRPAGSIDCVASIRAPFTISVIVTAVRRCASAT